MAIIFNPIAGILQFVKTKSEVLRDLLDFLGEPNGFKIPGNSAWTRAYNAATRTVTLTPIGTQKVFVGGKTFSYSAPITSTHAATNNTDFYFVINSSGQLVNSTTVWDLEDETLIPAAFVHYDAAYTPAGYALAENHGRKMDGAAHREFHETIGTYQVLPSSGGAAGGLTAGTFVEYATASGTNPTLADITPGVNAITLRDEDLPANLAVQLEGGTNYMRFDRLWGSNKWGWVLNDSPFRQVGNVPTFNPNTGADTFTSLVNQDYFCVYLLRMPVTDDATTQQFRNAWIVGQRKYTPTQNNDAARIVALNNALAESPNTLDLTGLPPEWFIDAKMVMRYNTGYTNNAYRLRCEGYQKLSGSRGQVLGLVNSGVGVATNDTNINITSGAVGGITGATETTQRLVNERLASFGYIAAWAGSTAYRVGNLVVINQGIFQCLTANSDSTFQIGNWVQVSPMSTPNAGTAASVAGAFGVLLYIRSAGMLYRYQDDPGAAADGVWFVNTAAGGTTRWVAIRDFGAQENTVTIAAGDAIDLGGQYSGSRQYAVTGSAAGRNAMNVLPFGTLAPINNIEVVLVGRSNTNTVTLATNDVAKGALISGGLIELATGTMLKVKYSPSLDRWVEVSRNNL